MKKSIFVYSVLILLVLLNSVGIHEASGTAPEPDKVVASEPLPAEITSSGMLIRSTTPTHKTILFNAMEQEEQPALEPREIPHLVLKRNGVLTPGYERTLEIQAINVPVYAPGVIVELRITTQHKNPDPSDPHGIQVWNERRYIPYSELTQQGVSINFSVTFDRKIKLENDSILTPTDYYKYQISVIDLSDTIRDSYTEEFAFLMENHWRVPLPKLLETEPGAAPSHLLVYYYDMIPYQANLRDPFSQIPREGVERYIQTELIPAMVQAIQTQSNDWEFPWYPEWRNFRRDEDPKTLSVALGEYGTWFHGTAPSLGHSMISIRVDGSVGEYDNLTDGLMSIFHHELFHNLQRNIALHFNDQADVAGREGAWEMFSEGTAVLASAVGQPEIQFERNSVSRSYIKRANSFIGINGALSGGLNKSYSKIPYHTAIYWRYLYENCGGASGDEENSTEGMKVIKLVLEILYSGEVIDIYSSTDAVESLPLILNKALASSTSCPFRSYGESLSQFADTIYSLRLNGGGGFHDPNELYRVPSAESVTSTSGPLLVVNGDIRSSYGIDMIEIKLSQIIDGKSIAIMFDRASNSDAEFIVKAIPIKTVGIDNTRGNPSQLSEPKLLKSEKGHVVFSIDTINTDEFDCLGLIITRMDPNEKQDPIGGYTLRLIVE